MRSAVAFILSSLVGACMPLGGETTWTEVKLRDPRQVSVVASSPFGVRTVSPAGAPAGTAYLAETVPPFAAADCLGARVIRGENGAIVLQRRGCAERDQVREGAWTSEVLVDRDGRVVLFSGAPRFTGDALRWVVTMSRSWRERAGRTTRVHVAPVVTVEVVTPRENVISIVAGRAGAEGGALRSVFPGEKNGRPPD